MSKESASEWAASVDSTRVRRPAAEDRGPAGAGTRLLAAVDGLQDPARAAAERVREDLGDRQADDHGQAASRRGLRAQPQPSQVRGPPGLVGSAADPPDQLRIAIARNALAGRHITDDRGAAAAARCGR